MKRETPLVRLLFCHSAKSSDCIFTFHSTRAMAEKSSAVLAFLRPVLRFSTLSGTFPVQVQISRLCQSPFLVIASKVYIMIVIACNIYATFSKFYTHYTTSAVASFATLAGDLFLTISNVSVYWHLSFRVSEIVTTITKMVDLEKRFTLKNNIRQRAASLKNYMTALELIYLSLNLRQHFFMGNFSGYSYLQSCISFIKELPMMSIELQFIFLTSLIKGFYKDINQELMKTRVDEKTLGDIRSYLNSLQNMSEKLDKEFGLTLLLFLVCLNVYLNCDCFWFVSTLYEDITDSDTLFKLVFLGVCWGGFDLIRVFSYFWVSASTSAEVNI